MNPNKLYTQYIQNNLDHSDLTEHQAPIPNRIGELSLYKFIDHPSKDAELLSVPELTEKLKAFQATGIDELVLHYGHFFNADYTDMLTLIHYAHQWFEGKIYTLSPEEIVFLAIRGDKTVDEVLDDLKLEGVSNILGFLPYSIVQSKYYADMDELLIEDRHHVFNACIHRKIEFIYPFNLGQVEFEDEFTEMINFIETNSVKQIILQPNDLIDTDQKFDYTIGQRVLSKIYSKFLLPLHMEIPIYYSNLGFPILTNLEKHD
jgi:hypothetical protein